MAPSPDYAKLTETVTLIAHHPACPEKRGALDLCQKAIDDLRDSGTITEDQWTRLRTLLIGSSLQSTLTAP